MLSKHVAQCQHFPSRAPCLVRSLPGPRTCLLIYLITAMGGVWILEQPRSSLVSWHPRIRLLWKSIPKAPKSKPILWTNAWEHMLLRSFMNNHYFGSYYVVPFMVILGRYGRRRGGPLTTEHPPPKDISAGQTAQQLYTSTWALYPEFFRRSWPRRTTTQNQRRRTHLVGRKGSKELNIYERQGPYLNCLEIKQSPILHSDPTWHAICSFSSLGTIRPCLECV